MTSDRPNVVVILLDTARADGFEPYGAAPGSSPAIAQLASRGAAFERAYAPCNWTMPSHVSMFTGLLPRTAGLSILPGGKQENCRPVIESQRDRVLAEVLRRAGYHTAGASTNLWVSERLGFATGFDEWHDLVGKRVTRMHDNSIRSRAIWYAQNLLAHVDDGLRVIERQTERWIDAHDGTPFFWFVNLIECHSPYLPPKPYNDLGPLRRLLAAQDARRYQTLTGVWRACATEVPPPASALERMRHLYARSIRMMDDWLARFLEKLDRRRLLDDTIVIVTSDHGENFGEGNLIGHAVSLDDRLIRIPFVAAGPGMSHGPAKAWSLARLPSVIADAIGIDETPWVSSDLPEGPAVAQYDVGIDPNEPRLEIMRRDWGATEEGIRRFVEPATCATDGRYKLFALGDFEQLYDLERDPMETDPMRTADAPTEVVETLRRTVAEANATAHVPDLDELAQRAASASDTDDIEERMKLLGYL